RLETCLTDTNSTGQVLAASVSMLGALVSSGEDPLGQQTAVAISKLSNVMRESKFAGVLKKLNQQEFMASIQCIMETTSESYCSARDSRHLFNEMKKALKVRKAEKDEADKTPFPSKIRFDNPLYGFYVLTQFSPIVTDWLFKIQIGVTPRLKEDGQYQIRILNEINNFYTATKNIEAVFNNTTSNIQTFPDYDSKKNYAKQLVLDIASLLLNGGGLPGVSTDVNFFQKAGSPSEIPFILLGMPTPPEVISQGAMMPPDVWLNNNYRTMPIFNNPEQIPAIVQKNLQLIIDSASKNALSYYNERFVADPIGMVNESFIGLPYSIKISLYSIDSYLAHLSQKMKTYAKDQTLLGAIEDTRMRLGKIFYRYNDLAKVIHDYRTIGTTKHDSKTEIEFKKKFLKKNVNLINEIYTQFDVMKAKSGFLANRLITFVQADFQMFIKDVIHKSNKDTDLIYKEIAYASGKMIFDRLERMAGNNPTLINLDLDSALRIYKENLAAQEMLLSDSFIGILSQLKLSSEKEYYDSRNVTFNSVKRAYLDGWTSTSNEDRNPVVQFINGIWNTAKTLTGFEEQRYPIQYRSFVGIKDDTIYSVDDEFRSAKNVFNRMCIQGLAFTSKADMRAVYNLCKNVTLRSPFDINQIPDDFKKSYNDYLSINFSNKLKENYNQDFRLNLSNRICAFRDYNRRNLVVNLTMNFREASQLENNYSDNPYEDITQITPDPSVKPIPNNQNSLDEKTSEEADTSVKIPDNPEDLNQVLIPNTFKNAMVSPQNSETKGKSKINLLNFFK
ncbi:MAG: hypothetical protein KDD45_06845, partial [Bdellovibrionales bacterium]|nr:hypothetical protein [Bdellovibrionales bacterium]